MAKKPWQAQQETAFQPDADVHETATSDEVRPWHGHENPWEAMFQWMKGELEKVGGGKAPAPVASKPADPAAVSVVSATPVFSAVPVSGLAPPESVVTSDPVSGTGDAYPQSGRV